VPADDKQLYPFDQPLAMIIIQLVVKWQAISQQGNR
jgi:hypothetical protein